MDPTFYVETLPVAPSDEVLKAVEGFHSDEAKRLSAEKAIPNPITAANMAKAFKAAEALRLAELARAEAIEPVVAAVVDQLRELLPDAEAAVEAARTKVRGELETAGITPAASTQAGRGGWETYAERQFDHDFLNRAAPVQEAEAYAKEIRTAIEIGSRLRREARLEVEKATDAFQAFRARLSRLVHG